ncbi:hypothetical protein TRVL_03366 [Trypanosoma vivax]|nr:hypothetical protein TRVL_03366 [Trypanosoma vivax]
MTAFPVGHNHARLLLGLRSCSVSSAAHRPVTSCTCPASRRTRHLADSRAGAHAVQLQRSGENAVAKAVPGPSLYCSRSSARSRLLDFCCARCVCDHATIGAYVVGPRPKIK